MREHLLELGSGIKQQVRKGRLEEEDMWDTQEMRVKGAGKAVICNLLQIWG